MPVLDNTGKPMAGGRPGPGQNLASFQEYTDEQIALYVARDRAETMRAKSAEEYKRSLTVIASSKHTEEMCQKDMADFFIEMQVRFRAWCAAQDAVDRDQQRVADELAEKFAAEQAAQAKLAEIDLKAKEAAAGLLQGKDVAENLSLVIGGGVGSTMTPPPEAAEPSKTWPPTAADGSGGELDPARNPQP